MQRQLRRIEYGAVKLQIIAQALKHCAWNTDIEQLEIRVVEKIIAVHVPWAHQNERALGKQLRASIYGVDGPAVRDEKQLVKIMRVNFIRRRHTALVQNARTLTGVQIFFGKSRSSTSLISAPPFFCYYNASKNGIKKFQF